MNLTKRERTTLAVLTTAFGAWVLTSGVMYRRRKAALDRAAQGVEVPVDAVAEAFRELYGDQALGSPTPGVVYVAGANDLAVSAAVKILEGAGRQVELADGQLVAAIEAAVRRQDPGLMRGVSGRPGAPDRFDLVLFTAPADGAFNLLASPPARFSDVGNPKVLLKRYG